MMNDHVQALASHKIIRYTSHNAAAEWRTLTDDVASEILLHVYINNRPIASLTCSPWDLDIMAAGFLASEDIVYAKTEIKDIHVDLENRQINFDIPKHAEFLHQHESQTDLFESLCGKTRQANYGADDTPLRKISKDNAHIAPHTIVDLMERLMTKSEAFQRTGGLHAGYLVQDGAIVLSHEDVSRNNVLDRILGECLLKEVDTANAALIFSGRVSSEVILKVVHMGVPILVSHSAPLQRALELAELYGVTVVAFTRNGNFNVYTQPHRVLDIDAKALDAYKE